MTSIKQVVFGIAAVGFAACASVASAQEARFTVGDLSNSAERAAFDRTLAKTTTQFCGTGDDRLGHLSGYGDASDYKSCAAAVRDEVFAQLSPQSRQQYAAVSVSPVFVASAAR